MASEQKFVTRTLLEALLGKLGDAVSSVFEKGARESVARDDALSQRISDLEQRLAALENTKGG